MTAWVRAGLVVATIGVVAWALVPSDVPLPLDVPKTSVAKAERGTKAKRQRQALDALGERYARDTRTVKVHVVDCGRQAAVHANVSVLAGGEQVAGMSDELGIFRAPVPADAGEVTASATLDAHHGMGGGVAEVEVVICPGATVEGIVRDEAGRPLRDAIVRFGAGEDVAVTEEDGEFVLSDQYLTASRITVEHPSGVAELTLDPLLNGGEARQVELTIQSGRRVVGQVVDAQGAVVPNVRIVVVDARGTTTQTVTADRDGRFWLKELPFEAVTLTIDDTRGSASVPVAPSATEVTVRLVDDRSTLVVYWEGAKAGTIAVDLGSYEKALRSGVPETFGAPQRLRIVVRTADEVFECGEAMLTVGARVEVRCGKPRDALVTGRLVDVRGRAVPSARWMARIATHGQTTTLDGATDSGGRFSLRYLADAATTAQIQLGLDDPKLDPVERRNVQVTPGQTTDVGDIVMRDPAMVSAMFEEERGTGTFGGLGGQLEQHDNGISFSRIVSEGPLARAGVQRGDTIIDIDGEPASQLTTREVMLRLRGKAGSSVQLRLSRPAEGNLELKLERAIIDPRGSWVD